jgi:hypothetical protein
MSSIFVDPNDLFQVKVRYLPLFDETGRQTGVRVLPSGADPEGFKELTCQCRGRDFETMSMVLQESTVINHRTHEPMVSVRVFCRMVVLAFFVDWDAVHDESGEPIELAPDAVRYMHHSLVRSLVRNWLAATG